MRAQLPTSGQVPAALPVQQASGTPAAVHTRLGSQPLQRFAAEQLMPLYGPPTHVLAPPQLPPGQSEASPHDIPAKVPPAHVPRQIPAEPPPGAIVKSRGPAVGVIVAVLVGGEVGVIVGVLVIVGVSVGVLVCGGVFVTVGVLVIVGVLVNVGVLVIVGVWVTVGVMVGVAVLVGVPMMTSMWQPWLQPSPLLRLPSSQVS